MTPARLPRPQPAVRVAFLALAVLTTFLCLEALAAQTDPPITVDRTLPAAPHEEEPTIPANLHVPAFLRPVIDIMWLHSPTFKAQCARLSRAALVVNVRLDIAERRARTTFFKSMGRAMRAEIYIGNHAGPIVELMAHELEHIVEQLDDVQLAADKQHGVSQGAGGAFETARAVHIGQKVAGEVQLATERRLARR